MFVFLALLAVVEPLRAFGSGFFFRHAEFWIYPVQTVAGGALVWSFRRSYPLQRPRFLFFTLAIAFLVFLLWIAPQQFFHFPPRREGFDLQLVSGSRILYLMELALRFLRLVIVVPFVEEIFWRSFLLRFLIDEKFECVPFGRLRPIAFIVVVAAFCFSHARADWPAAALAGAFYNVVAWRTGNLSSCVVAHAMTNLLLGLWIMQSGQWGFW